MSVVNKVENNIQVIDSRTKSEYKIGEFDQKENKDSHLTCWSAIRRGAGHGVEGSVLDMMFLMVSIPERTKASSLQRTAFVSTFASVILRHGSWT